jgi:hypothetical protein
VVALIKRNRFVMTGLLVIASCTNKPKIQPVNEINEPVFFRANHLAVEATLGRQVINSDIDSTYKSSLLFEPNLLFDVNVSEWSSYTVWPLLWNFLLTGDQYSDSASLRIRKFNIAAHLGLNGLGYSQREDIYFSGGLGVRTKILLSQKMFIRTDVFFQLNDIREISRGIGTNALNFGLQINQTNSILFSHSISIYRIEDGAYYLKNGIAYFNEDINNEFRIGHKMYLGKNHVLGPEIGYGFINSKAGKDDYYLIGFKYRYVSN